MADQQSALSLSGFFGLNQNIKKSFIFIWRQKNDTLFKDSQYNIIENIFKLNCEDK